MIRERVKQRILCLCTRLVLFVFLWGGTENLRADKPSPFVTSFLKSYCNDCHSGESSERGYDLSKLDWNEAADFESLVQMHDRIHDGEMPPASGVQPSQSEKERVLSELSDFLIARDQERVNQEGRSLKRRLNRYEYENTLRDLLNLPWLQIRDMLPEDGELYRYNKIGQALDVSHVQLARYMSAADHAIKHAISVNYDRPATTVKRYYARDEPSLFGNFQPRENGTLPDRLSFPVLDSMAQPDVRSGKQPRSSPETRDREAVGKVSSIFSDAGGYSWGQFRVPASGRYKLRFKGYSIWVSGGGIGRWFYEGFGESKAPVFHLPLWHRPNLDEVWPGRRSEPMGVYAQSSGKSRALGEFDFGTEPTVCEIETTLVANEVIQTDGLRLFRTRVNGTDEQYVNPLATEAGMPGYAIQWMEAEGPLDDESVTAGYKLLFDDLKTIPVGDESLKGILVQVPAKSVGSTTPAPGGSGQPVGPASQGSERTSPSPSARPRRGFGPPRMVDLRLDVISDNPLRDSRRLLKRFMERAYRQNVNEQDFERFLALYDQQMDLGVGFANAMIAAYTAVLASPGLLYIDEQPGPLKDDAIATRLGLFLWNSEPDLELRQLARDGHLNDRQLIKKQVNRMLDDPRSHRLVEGFTDYWLDLRKVNDTSPSTTLYNDYELDEPLKLAAIEETRMFVAKLISDNLPARNIVASDFTFLNERLASHYQIPGVSGAKMRFVTLPDNSLRGGLITQASILKVTANGTTTSPVVRGSWITERILGIRTQPPPSVPAVEPDIRGAVTIRQQLEMHRADANCSSCHSLIDPPGFALEAFDVMGGFRERYRAVNENVRPTPGVGMNGQAFVFHDGPAVDCTGTLANGLSFQDVRELKQLLLRDERAVARNFVHQLVIYATGGRISFSDRVKIEQILDSTQEGAWPIRSIIHAVVQSDLFLNK